MPNISPNSILHPYLDLLVTANFTFMFECIVEMICGQRAVASTIQFTDIISTYDTTYGVHYWLAPNTVLTLHNASKIWFTILLHATNNVPYHTVAMPLTIPTCQAHELGLADPDDIAIGYYHNCAHQLASAWYTDMNQLFQDLDEHLEGLCSGYAWLDERIEQSVALGFESTINWGIVGQASWPEFLVCFYPDRVNKIAKEMGMTTEELLTHYQVDNTQALLTFVVPTNVIVPYDPYYPAFTPPSPVVPSAFDNDLDLPEDSDSDFSFSDFSDSDDTSDTDMSSNSDTDDGSDPDDPGFFFGCCWRDDDEDYGAMSATATTGYSEDACIIQDDERTRGRGTRMNEHGDAPAIQDEPWFTIVCYNDDGNEVRRKRLQFSKLSMT
ncbi:hypothetical protein IW262DRAFT_1293614 [Armillaria fumosa]|nr:hypothetical protein IW262DRAFT_1293614 [Armillaria fumosa]